MGPLSRSSGTTLCSGSEGSTSYIGVVGGGLRGESGESHIKGPNWFRESLPDRARALNRNPTTEGTDEGVGKHLAEGWPIGSLQGGTPPAFRSTPYERRVSVPAVVATATIRLSLDSHKTGEVEDQEARGSPRRHPQHALVDSNRDAAVNLQESRNNRQPPNGGKSLLLGKELRVLKDGNAPDTRQLGHQPEGGEEEGVG